MAYEEKYRAAETPHNIIMEGRRKISVSGAIDVESFDENEIVMGTTQGVLILRGKDLRIEKLSLDSGDVIIEGIVDRLEYEDEVKPSEGFFSRLFR